MAQEFREFIRAPWALHAVNAAVLFLGVVLLGYLVKRILSTVGRKLTSKTDTQYDDLILDVVLPRIKWLALIAGLYLGTEEIAKGLGRSETALQMIRYTNGLLYVAFIIVVTTVLIRLSDVSLRFAVERHALRTSSKLNEALLPLSHRLIMIIILLIATITALGHFGVDVSSLLVFLGGSSVAIALAAQDTLQNMIAGFVIMLDRPFRLGDRIKLPSGEIGDVQEIGLRSTKVLDFDNNVIISPNAELVKTKIINYSYPRNEIRVLVEIPVAYGTDIEQARDILLEYAAGNPNILAKPTPEVFVANLGESAVNLMFVARTDDWKKKWLAETTIREQVYQRFMTEGIRPGHPQRVVQLQHHHAAPEDRSIRT
ncbi:MAG: mechanosensitive ion channel family protein [Bacteroidetes bacterium]|jgi:small-conductance mechanosensitive channel|nr:mechanosensitive ion channel family protein [Bacteroidota bacterium]